MRRAGRSRGPAGAAGRLGSADAAGPVGSAGSAGPVGSLGSAAIEMAVLMPLFVALFTAAVVLGRTGTALSAVEMAAYDGARTASLARDADTARSEATAAVERSLADRGLSCVDGPDVELPGLAAAFGQPVGVRASVTVRVACRVTYGDVDLVGVPDDRELSARFVSPLDQYRARR